MPTISVVTPTIRPEGLSVVQEALQKQTYQDFEWLVEVGLPKRGHDLNAAYNRMLRRATGTYIVSLQDWIIPNENGLQIFLDALEADKRFYTAPVGLTSLRNPDESDRAFDYDWRKHRSSTDTVTWNEWEIDWAAAPLEALKQIGGFDEALDAHWSSDNVNVGYRAQLHGYQFGNLPENIAYGIKHDELSEHPFRAKYNPDFNNERMERIKLGEIQLTL